MCIAILYNSVTVIIIALNKFFLQLYCVVVELNRKKKKTKKIQEEVKFTFDEKSANRAKPTEVRIICTCDNGLRKCNSYIYIFKFFINQSESFC